MTFEAVLFDCDGVLVDSEPLTMQVLRDMLADAGWDMDLATCMGIFVGKTVRSERVRIEAQTRQPLTDAWMDAFYARRNAALQQHLVAIDGVLAAMPRVQALVGGKLACASGADRFKVQMQLDHVGLAPFFGTQVYVGHEMPRTKPFPDVYLAAAVGLGVDITRCLVVEDTATGATAGVAAGATVLGYCLPTAPAGQQEALRAAGVVDTIAHMADLPAWMERAALQRAQ